MTTVFAPTTSVIDPKETQGMLEKINNFIKKTGGYLTITIAATGCEVRCTHPSGVVSVIADSMAAPSDMVLEVYARMEEQLTRLAEAENLAAPIQTNVAPSSLQ